MRRKIGKAFKVGRIVGWAAGRGYKYMVAIVNEDMKRPGECPPRCTGTYMC